MGSDALCNDVLDRRVYSVNWHRARRGRSIPCPESGDIPVELPAKFELIANLETAKAIGLEVSTVLLNRVDHVIE